jgi:predicted RNA polymerase sigma factor
VEILQGALARDRHGEFEARAAIAALHADTPTAQETDWVQVVEWYDELGRLTDSPAVRRNRAVAVGEADGPRAALAALAALDDSLPRYAAEAAYLHERDGDRATTARQYAEAAQMTPTSPRKPSSSPDRPPGSTPTGVAEYIARVGSVRRTWSRRPA